MADPSDLGHGKKTISVLAHSFYLPERDNSGYILFIYPLMYTRNKPVDEAKMRAVGHVLSTFSG